ncbi:hypothetical protein E4U27_007882, partial [Claviceps purpurea]
SSETLVWEMVFITPLRLWLRLGGIFSSSIPTSAVSSNPSTLHSWIQCRAPHRFSGTRERRLMKDTGWPKKTLSSTHRESHPVHDALPRTWPFLSPYFTPTKLSVCVKWPLRL